MGKKSLTIMIAATPILIAVLISGICSACTDFQVKTKDGNVIIGRSMEFSQELDSHILWQPRGIEYASKAPGGKKGLTWKSNYGFVAVAASGNEEICDGLNEEGLSVGFLMLQESKYQDVSESEEAKAIAVTDLGIWMLGNFASASEVKKAIKDVRVWGDIIPELGEAEMLHVAVHDAEGNNIVIEFVKGKQRIYDNPLGVLTNSPTFDWHIANLRNYVNLTSANARAMSIGQVKINPVGMGSGMRGIPGDWTPPSRFVRAILFTHLADPAETADDGVNLAEHILNAVDIPHGTIKGAEVDGKETVDYTQWVVIKDLKNKIFYFRTYEDLNLRSVDLKKLDFSEGAKFKSVPMRGKSLISADITDSLR